MKILCLPDIHGRDFWIEPCHNWQGSIVFLGDYHDPYTFQVSKEESLENLKKLVEFVTDNRDRCTCLFGNHDNYGFSNVIYSESRHDYLNHTEVHNLLSELNLQLIKIVEPNVIFSHSGILPKWLEEHNLDWHNLNSLSLNDKSLGDISPYRNGEQEVGSCIFGDAREYNKQEHIPNYYQIFGHSQLVRDPIIKEDYACLDCRKCFIVDTETKEIKEWTM